MKFLALDFGSSSVKAAVLSKSGMPSHIARAPCGTRHDGVCVEVQPSSVLKAMRDCVTELGDTAREADVIALSVMSPAWVAMDRRGRALTPLITHQDRRSVDVALELEKRIGDKTFLRLTGNLPVPGGISATTWAWYLKHHSERLRRADLVGHLNTFLHRHLTGARVIDPSNASFTGLYLTNKLAGWSEQMCDAIGVSTDLLPQVLEADRIGGKVTREAARRFGLTEGQPVLAGIVDTSSAMLLSGAAVGQLTNNCGSTDVLGLCTDRAFPHERLLTRALGVGRRWMSVSTIAAAGSSLQWAKDQLFSDLSSQEFWLLVSKLAAGRAKTTHSGTVRFEPYLAGERTSVQQRQGAFAGLTLSTTRQEMLAAIIESLAQASAARLDLFRQLRIPMRRRVMLTGGTQSDLAGVLHRNWKGKWSFYVEEEATLRGLAKLDPKPA